MVTATPVAPHISNKLYNIDEYTILAEIDIDDMFVAPYGRAVSSAQVGRMLKRGFDKRKLGIITLSMRADGRYAILDGNHRRYLAKHVGQQRMLSRVFIDLLYEEEAELFEALNTVKPPTALERFTARVEYKEPRALAIQRLLGRYNLRVATYSGARNASGALTCVGALDAVYDERGPVEFEEIIHILYDAWELEQQAWVGRMLDGMRQFWARYRDTVDRVRLIEQMQLTTPSRVLAKAGVLSEVGQETPATMVGKELVRLYNGRARSKKLPEWASRITNIAQRPDDIARKIGQNIVDQMKEKG